MKNENFTVLFFVLVCSILMGCKSSEKQIIGNWIYLENHQNRLSKDEEETIIKSCKSETRTNFGNPVYYHKNQTLVIDNECYETTGSYRIKGDTLFETFSLNDKTIIDKYLLINTRRNLLILKDSHGDYIYFWKIRESNK